MVINARYNAVLLSSPRDRRKIEIAYRQYSNTIVYILPVLYDALQLLYFYEGGSAL
jgi:hypothetical protein